MKDKYSQQVDKLRTALLDISVYAENEKTTFLHSELKMINKLVDGMRQKIKERNIEKGKS